MELWDLYTEDRILTGKSHVRGERMPENLFHLVVHIWIKNSKGQYLISQRAADRPTCPLMWETVGGSVLKGEDSFHGALREVKEEVGIDLSPEKGRLVFLRSENPRAEEYITIYWTYGASSMTAKRISTEPIQKR